MEIKKVIEYFVHHKDWDYILVIIRETRKINYSCWIVQIKEIKASSLFLNRSLSNCDRNLNNFTSPPRSIKTLISRDSNFF